jgi:hypothetical protein
LEHGSSKLVPQAVYQLLLQGQFQRIENGALIEEDVEDDVEIETFN